MEEKIYVLARFSDNWADEIDVDCYKVLEFDREEYDDFLKRVEFCRNYQGEMSYGVGSNEWIEYENGADYLSAISLEVISKEDYEVFKRLDMLSCGDDSFIEAIYDLYWDNEEED